jgi:hypothetical protein|tara:strand:+ start:312 stop:1367 length:1056 start_codon:yes stop_codon:yes gene_type:complete
MGFSGGGSNTLKPHKHSSAVQDGSPLNMDNVTEASLTAGDIVYSDGSALQRLAIGADTTVLAVSGSTPSWSAATSNPLIKVSKTYSDIVGTEMDIYTLPQDAALVNVYTDITTPFTLSTGVTVGDAGDDNGFLQAIDWTGAGLTDATRGAYVTSFKTMRSTSGTTAIKAYNFTVTSSGSVFTQSNTDDAYHIGSGQFKELCQLYQTGQTIVGQTVCKASFFMKIAVAGSGALGTITANIRRADGTLVQASSTLLNASTLTASYVEYVFDFASTVIAADDMICVNGDGLTGGFEAIVQFWLTDITNGEMYWLNVTGPYTQQNPGSMKMNVTYACTTSKDTAGEVDYYLQVVD